MTEQAPLTERLYRQIAHYMALSPINSYYAPDLMGNSFTLMGPPEYLPASIRFEQLPPIPFYADILPTIEGPEGPPAQNVVDAYRQGFRLYWLLTLRDHWGEPLGHYTDDPYCVGTGIVSDSNVYYGIPIPMTVEVNSHGTYMVLVELPNSLLTVLAFPIGSIQGLEVAFREGVAELTLMDPNRPETVLARVPNLRVRNLSVIYRSIPTSVVSDSPMDNIRRIRDLVTPSMEMLPRLLESANRYLDRLNWVGETQRPAPGEYGLNESPPAPPEQPRCIECDRPAQPVAPGWAPMCSKCEGETNGTTE